MTAQHFVVAFLYCMMLRTLCSRAVAHVARRGDAACGIVGRNSPAARISSCTATHAAQAAGHGENYEGVQMYDSADAATTALAGYNHRELCTAVYMIDEAKVPANDIFGSVVTEAIPRIDEFSADDLVQMSAVFHKHSVHSADWYRAVSFHMVKRVGQLLPGGVATLLKVTSREDVIVADLFEACAKLVASGIDQDIERQNAFTAEQQASVAESCTAAGYSFAKLAQALAGSVQKHITAYTPEQVSAIEAYVTKAGFADAAFRAAVASHGDLYAAHEAYKQRSNQDDSPIYSLGQKEDLQQSVIRKAKVFLDDPANPSA